MTERFIKTPEDGYWLDRASIKKVEELRGAKYMGYWCTMNPKGFWNEQPVDVFYQPNPDLEQGHSHYFGIFIKENSVFICDAASAFSETIGGIITEDGEVLVSRYRHDYVTKEGGYMIDGGRDYMKASLHQTVAVNVKDGEFIIGGFY